MANLIFTKADVNVLKGFLNNGQKKEAILEQFNAATGRSLNMGQLNVFSKLAKIDWRKDNNPRQTSIMLVEDDAQMEEALEATNYNELA